MSTYSQLGIRFPRPTITDLVARCRRDRGATAQRRWRRWTGLAVLVLSFTACSGSPSSTPTAEGLRLDQIQVLGSHNSYKRAIDPSLFTLYLEQRPEVARSLDYSHPSLTEQLEHGLRKLELDVFYDPEGGRYAEPYGVRLVAEAGLPPGPPFDPEGRMRAPGFKVLHVQDLDFRSNCLTLALCLDELRRFSEAHPGHLPVAIMMNAKDDRIDRPGFVEPLPFDAVAFDALDREVLEGLGRERLIVPDDVRGELASLEEAVLARGWPALDELRGRFLFVLDEGGEKLATYVAGHPALAGRVFFVDAGEGRPEAAFRIVNDPVAHEETIRRLVERGYLVRTRADADTAEARSGDTRRRDAAWRSGAHFVSTDYYEADPDLGTGYRVSLPGGGVARCNPVTTAAPCTLGD